MRVITINYRDSRPVYTQVKDSLRQLIVTGALPPRQKLSSVRELAAQLAINPNTIQRAYRELEAEGYIVSVPGRGSFVCERSGEETARRAELLRRFDEITAELRWLGGTSEELTSRMEGENHDA